MAPVNSKSELTVENCVVAWAERYGILHVKLNLQFRRGWPDRMFLIPGGRPLLIEFKRPGKQLELLQAHVISKLKALNYDVHWTSKAEEAIYLIAARVSAAASSTQAP